MALVNKPDESIFASSAKQGEVDNFPDLLRGWGISFEQTGGIPPMEWFNFLFKRLDEKHSYLMQRGLPEWSATQDYPAGAFVQYQGLSYKALRTNKNVSPSASNSADWQRWGFTLTEIAKASLTQQGIVQLTNALNSDAENLALTAKAGKALAQQTVQAKQEIIRDYIPNTKKSSAVNSTSTDMVATSAAVKTAYDKGVEAKNAADGAQRTANDGVSKATTAQNTANSAVTKADNAQRAADNANNNANNRVSKSGDTMTGNLTVPNLIVNDPTNNNNFVQIGDDTKLIDVDMVHTVGLQAADNANDAYIAYGATKKRFGFDGVNFSAESGLGAQWFGSQKRGEGAYVNQWRTEAPYHVQAGNANGSNTYFPYLKGKITNGNGWGAAFSFGYTTPGARNQFGTGIIHLIEDNGKSITWNFEHNGDFVAPGDVLTVRGKSLNNATQLSDFTYQKIGNFEIRKYPDGTMIQTYAVEIANKNTQKWSEHFNWAVAFASKPTVIPILAGITDDTNATDTYILYNKTLSSNTKCVYHTHEYSWHGTKLLAEFTAIGRWK